MPQHKITFFFAASILQTVPASTVGALGGWTETFYDPRDISDTAALNSSFAALTARRGILTPGWRCYLIRASRFPLSRTAAKLAVQPTDGAGTFGVIGGPALDDKSYSVLVVNFSSVSGRGRAFGLRGVGSNVVGANGLFLNPATWQLAFPLFQAVWAGTNPYAIRVTTQQTKQLVTGVLVGPIAGVPAAAPTTPAVQTAGAVLAGPPFPAVRISGVLGLANLNGLWQVSNSVQVAGVTTHQLSPKRGRAVQGAYIGGGTLTPFTAALENIVTATPGQGGPHKVGRAPFAPRGRRSRRQL